MKPRFDEHAPGYLGRLRLGLTRGPRGAVPDPTETAMLKRTDELLSWGMSTSRVAERLTAEGFRTRDGKPITGSNIRVRMMRQRRRAQKASDYQPASKTSAKLDQRDHLDRLADDALELLR